ncbi:unnamed protein product [Gordionus sp. m RMFG-2023]
MRYSIIFNSRKIFKNQAKIEESLPIISQYFVKDNKKVKSDLLDLENKLQRINYPYSSNNQNKIQNYSNTNIKSYSQNSIYNSLILDHLKNIQFENLSEREISKLLIYKRKLIEADLNLYFGLPDAKVKISSVPCYGCGAFLQCKDDTLAGYVPSNLFKSKTNLGDILCQRCSLLTHFNYPINVRVDHEKYSKTLHHIKNEDGLVLLLLDIFDINHSIKHDILEIIGQNKYFYIIGNKIDLLPKDSSNWLRRVKTILKKEVLNTLNLDVEKLMGISLISAKSGYGVENLITKLQTLYNINGNVYLIGCANVGKSTLFNTLLHSDYSRGHANEIINRATTSTWPGTTLNMLNFPLNKPSTWKLAARNRRLNYISKFKKYIQSGIYEPNSQFSQTNVNPYYDKLISEALTVSKSYDSSPSIETELDSLVPSDIASLINSSARSIKKYSKEPNSDNNIDPKNTISNLSSDHRLIRYRNQHLEKISNLKHSSTTMRQNYMRAGKRLYDTPGLVNNDQILNLLTFDEIIHVIPKVTVNPRTCILTPGMSLLVAGLARIDYLQGQESIFLTMFVSQDLPLNVVETSKAETFYAENLRNFSLKVPTGSNERLLEFPPLTSKDFEINGDDKWKSSADILLSSLGWASFTTDQNNMATIRAYTPAGKGLGLRKPALLPFAVNKRGGLSKVPNVYHTLPFEKWTT